MKRYNSVKRIEKLYAIRYTLKMPSIKKKIIVKNKQGLHARPAALFVQLANKFDSRITIKRDNYSEYINGKSIMGILMLGAEEGTAIMVEADGEDANLAMLELEKLLNNEE